jgi:putative oxidoreductase
MKKIAVPRSKDAESIRSNESRALHTRLAHWCTLIDPDGPKAVLLIRLAVGIVFASEGIQKFMYPAAYGAGRFAKIGIPAPEEMGAFVGGVETLCGLLVLAGLFTRVAAAPLMCVMAVALVSTKLPILLGHGYWIFAHTFAPKSGVWSFLHESRTDISMFLAAAFLCIVGGGGCSIDAALARKFKAGHEHPG